MSKRWTEDDDRRLVVWGGQVGSYSFVASHDLGRSKDAGTKRINWLRKNRPEFVAKLEAEYVLRGDE